MAASIYVASAEAGAGKSLVALGVCELAARRGGRVGFFRPIVRYDAARDPSVRLVVDRYLTNVDPAALVGLNREQARALLAEDRVPELIATVLAKFRTLRDGQAALSGTPREPDDLVVVEGTSFRGFAPTHEFDLNADLAANFGSAVLPVFTARGKTPADLRDAIAIAFDQFGDRGCEVLAAVVNHVPESWDTAARASLTAPVAGGTRADGPPVWLLPEDPRLEHPSVGEIAAGLSATWLFGPGDPPTVGEAGLGPFAGAERSVGRFLVAAMQVPHFLEHLNDDALVVTPGDRDDILLASLAGEKSRTGPNIAGVLLTGGLRPDGAVAKLVDGLAGVPVLGVETDTFTTARNVAAVPAVLSPDAPRKVEAALELFDAHVDTDTLAEAIRVSDPRRVTPLMFEYELLRRAAANRKRVVLPEGTEPRILQAAETILRRGVADLILLGDPAAIRGQIAELKLETALFEGVTIENPADSPRLEAFAAEYHRLRGHKGVTPEIARDRMTDVSYYGTMLVHLGLADGMVSGSAHTTAHTIRPAFEFIKTKPGVGVVSGIFFMCLPDRVLVYGDCAVVPNPTADQLAEIAVTSADTAARFGVEPRVALLSYSTGESGSGEDVDRVREATAKAQSVRPDLPIDGPIQYDAAVDPQTAASKRPGSPVAGRATVLIFPDLNTGNNTYKAVQRSAGAVAVGPVLQGLNKPVNDLSRGCTVPDILNTVAITAIQAQAAAAEMPPAGPGAAA
ncbi:phosphate acetyltransferase [Alienimonas californiensis]|uniref:Phosphate acetyltransferase n=1 Tax=Alienimonas californiensis TaxID=2527989 RepID=A0A517P913_9PLAN|nr:phosphate acetyltransferase [Alienimonas californiensis]QDT15858.1 Phosphate acetyltransferase [Alienimonas californiensis]